MAQYQRYRLVTRSDFDGLVCAVLLREMDLIDSVKFVHPKDMQDGAILVSGRDITANLPFVEGVHLAFDHHRSETLRLASIPANCVIDADAASAARVMYDHFGGRERFPTICEGLLRAVDKIDAADLDRDDILAPEGWVLLGLLMDPRTGLGRFQRFRISDFDLMVRLVEACCALPLPDILALEDVRERIDLYLAHREPAERQLRARFRQRGPIGVIDLRRERVIYAANRFLVYALFPEIAISIHVLGGLQGLNTAIAAGKSIFNRTSRADIGALMLEYGGGGHANAGTCQVDNADADRVVSSIVERLLEAA